MKLKMAEYRKQAKISQRKLAELIGRSFRTVQKWENEETYPQADDLCKLCEIFGTDPNTLLGWYDEHPEDRPSSSVTRDEAALIDNYRASPPEVRSTITQVARLGAGSSGKEGRDASYEAEAV